MTSRGRPGISLGVQVLVGLWLAGCGGNTTGTPDTTTGNEGNVAPIPDPDTTVSAACSAAAANAVGMPGRGLGDLLGPQVGPTVTQPTAPPAISGGTLRVLADGLTVVAADPDRDQVYIINAANPASMSVIATVALSPGDEPGRMVQDAGGRVHVALRNGGALVTIDPDTATVIARRDACSAPRGVAYDSRTDQVHVACAGGELVSFPAAGGDAVRRLVLDRDLRDVIVDGDRLRISRFRSAELLTIDAAGKVVARMTPPGFRSAVARGGQRFSPAVAWKTMEGPDGGTMMLHQRGVDDPIQPVAGGYGGFNPCHSITHPAITREKADGTVISGPALAGLVLAVDMAVSPDGSRIAIVSAGNAHNSAGPFPNAPQTVFMTDMNSATDKATGCRPDGKHAPCGNSNGGILIPLESEELAAVTPGGMTGGADEFVACEVPPPRGTAGSVVGEAIAVAFLPDGNVIVQSRQPAMLSVVGGSSLTLSPTTRDDTGHTLFHANAGSFLACASCHAEGREDGRVWNLTCEGPRRTQSLQTGLAGTEPFHWNGDERDFPQLVQDVFTGRMSGPMLAGDQSAAILRWIDAQPRVHLAAAPDAVSAARGRDLFHDTRRAACSSCHAGERLTNNETVDVGTGGRFQVPSLIGISTRAPYIHNGCAPTLSDRFGSACAGGDKHGVTSILSSAEVSDLVAYLETL